MKQRILGWFLTALIVMTLIAGYQKWLIYAQAPYEWTREGNIYANAHYGLQITKKDGWLRSVEGPSLGSRFFLSQLFDNPVPLLFPKKDLIEFHKFGERQRPDAIIAISPVDDLKGKSYGRSLKNYARVSLESMMATRMQLSKGQIELMDLNGRPCAKSRVSFEIPKAGKVEGESYFFINNGKGFNIGYMAIPSNFDKYRDEAIEIIRSVRFVHEQQLIPPTRSAK